VAAGRDIERLLCDPEVFSIAPERVDLSELVAGLAGANVEAHAQPGLVVRADPMRLRQALGNLIANGVRHGEHVMVRASRSGDEAWITVADDGPGVEPGPDPFAAGVSSVGSTGLGLYLARSLAEAQGGTLELVSAQGAGACFRLALPLAGDAAG
jgi:signal transduction histidine kinase